MEITLTETGFSYKIIMKFKEILLSYKTVCSCDAAVILGVQSFLPEHGSQILAFHLKKKVPLKALDLHQSW